MGTAGGRQLRGHRMHGCPVAEVGGRGDGHAHACFYPPFHHRGPCLRSQRLAHDGEWAGLQRWACFIATQQTWTGGWKQGKPFCGHAAPAGVAKAARALAASVAETLRMWARRRARAINLASRRREIDAIHVGLGAPLRLALAPTPPTAWAASEPAANATIGRSRRALLGCTRCGLPAALLAADLPSLPSPPTPTPPAPLRLPPPTLRSTTCRRWWRMPSTPPSRPSPPSRSPSWCARLPAARRLHQSVPFLGKAFRCPPSRAMEGALLCRIDSIMRGRSSCGSCSGSCRGSSRRCRASFPARHAANDAR